jgi:hypothetical protein
VTTVRGELPQRIALDNPSTEPHELPPVLGQAVPPDVTVVTSATEPPLFPVACSPVTADRRGMTPGAMFFYS